MTSVRRTAICVVIVLCAAVAARAQDKTPEIRASATAFKIRLVLNEYDGEKKISSLPYSLTALVGGTRRLPSVRTGIRVPISTGSKDSEYQYNDIGTNLDITEFAQMSDGRYELAMTIERSSLYVNSKDSGNQPIEWSPGAERPSTLPLVRATRLSFVLLVRDGQSLEGAEVTDPLTGRVLKADVSLSMEK